jgi:vitamin B12 transporter
MENTFEAAKNPFNDDYTFDEVGNEVQLLLNLKLQDKPVVLSGGLSYLGLEYDRKPTGATSTTAPFDYNYVNKAIFTQVMWDINEQLRFTGSGRFDHFDKFENAATGNIELSYYIPSTETRFFMKYGEGMAPPEASDLARLDGDLKSEKINAWEIGMRQELLDKRLALGFVYFNSNIKNLVDDDGAFPVANYEVVDTKQQGLESELIWRLNKKLRARLGYTYLHAEVTSGTYFFSDNSGARLIRRPKHSISVNLDYEPTTRTRLGLGMLSAIDREDPAGTRHEDYEIFRVYGEYDIHERLTYFGRVENLLNQHYTATRGYSNSGSAIYFGGRFKF